MDNSSFPKVLEFQNKIPPNPQLLRLKDWFSRYDFTVRHVKGQHNIIADMLSRPSAIHLITSYGPIPLIIMAISASSSSSPNPTMRTYPPELLEIIPPTTQPSLARIQEFAHSYLRTYLAQIQSQGVRHEFSNNNRPFLDPFLMPPFYLFTPQVLWFLWCMSVLHHHAVVFPLQALYGFVHDPSQKDSLLITFLTWFNSLSFWRSELTKLMGYHNLWKLDKESASAVSFPPHQCYLFPTVIRDPSLSWHPFQDSVPDHPQDHIERDTWPCHICGAEDSDDDYHANCNLSSP
ncbi:hypothetical protein LWI28_027336 [Acer negundo]|uniref:Uncharacterized protein n=1 Tax=Acer negundo TaxID=4023 RepID=A0AAD5NP58_ACENE|nr:hypothetical protein LWI28_027336 [Acer negundo]